MERAFKFLKRTSLSCGAVAVGTGVAAEDNGGVVLTGDAVGEAPTIGAALGGDSSCAEVKHAAEIETSAAHKSESRAVIRGRF
jgi:hypothetical protein